MCAGLPQSSRIDRFGGCATCEGIAGIECAGDSQRTKAGYWWQFASQGMEDDYTAFATNLALSYNYNRSVSKFTGQIPRPYSCPQREHCLGGIDSACLEGTTGPLCDVCAPDYFRINGHCYECPASGASDVVSALAVVCFVILAGAFLVRSNAKSISTAVEDASQAGEAAANSNREQELSASWEGGGSSPLATMRSIPGATTSTDSMDVASNEGVLHIASKDQLELETNSAQHAEIVAGTPNNAVEQPAPWYFARGFTLFKITVQFAQIFGMITTV